jgi:hypothetical protein
MALYYLPMLWQTIAEHGSVATNHVCCMDCHVVHMRQQDLCQGDHTPCRCLSMYAAVAAGV